MDKLTGKIFGVLCGQFKLKDTVAAKKIEVVLIIFIFSPKDLELSVDHPKNTTDNKQLQEDLWYDLIKFMSLNVAYTIKRLLPADLKNLYNHQPLEDINNCKINPFAKDYEMTPNTEKGGINIAENYIYNW